MNNIVYRTTSSVELFRSLIMRVFFLALIIYMGVHYDENPVVISILIIASLYIFLIVGSDEIIIDDNQFVQKETALIGYIIGSKKIIHEINTIKTASLPEKPKTSFSEVGLVLFLTALFPQRTRANRQQQFHLNLRNGKTETISTDLSRNKILETIQIINSRTKNRTATNMGFAQSGVRQ